MLVPLQADSRYLKHRLRLPRNPLSNQNVLAIQINFEVESTPKKNEVMAQELYECLSVIKPEVLAELKKLLPNTDS